MIRFGILRPEILRRQTPRPAVARGARNFASELQAAREECLHRSRQAARPDVPPSPGEPDCDNSLDWLSTRARLEKAALGPTALAHQEEWAEDCGSEVKRKNPRQPRVIDSNAERD